VTKENRKIVFTAYPILPHYGFSAASLRSVRKGVEQEGTTDGVTPWPVATI
jgi:hypothetical protein